MSLAMRGDSDRDAFIANAVAMSLDVPLSWIDPRSSLNIRLGERIAGLSPQERFLSENEEYAELTSLRSKFRIESAGQPISDKAAWVIQNYSYFTNRTQPDMVQPS